MKINEFLQYFDGFSIGSNDLTQLTLGLDRDSADIAHLFDEQDKATQDKFDLPVLCTATIMNTLDDRIRLAGDVLRFSATLNP